MPRGKKYNAAEKHFIEKERRYQKQIRCLNDVIAAQKLEIEQLKIAVNERDNKILSQTDWINRLLEYTELEKEDIKAACETDKRRKQQHRDAVAALAFAERIRQQCLF